MYGGALDDGILAQVVAAHHHEGALRGVYVQPLRKQHVDLVHMFNERGVAGRVVLHVIGGAQTFTGIQGNFRRLALGFAARGALVFGVAESRGVGECLVIVAGKGQQQLREMLAAQHIEDKAGDHQGGQHGCYIQNAAQTLPALALRVVENLPIGHEKFR